MAKKKLSTLPRIIAAVVLVVLVALNIVMGVAPAVGTYKGEYKNTVLGTEVSKKITAEFKADKKLTMTNALSDKKDDMVEYTYEYDKENKNIVEANTKTPLLTRDSVFVMKTTATGTKLTSGLAITFQVLLGVGYLVCLVFVLTGGKKIKLK
ncbi:MAG TPA: hypothetical protein DHU65_00070 [Clostridiales bacterium]|nr:hypothetical protein [Clostridiales bacterium]